MPPNKVAGCDLFDSGVVWRQGPYALMWIDDPADVSLSFDEGKGSWSDRIEPRVFAVGANERYIVAKQHPKGDKRITHYFIIDLKEDSLPKPAVIGPLTAEDLARQSRNLRLPEFTKVLESLQ
jgi:hypothetical protein